MEILCPDSVPSFLNFFDLSIAPQLLYYTYVPAIITSLFLGLFVLVKNRGRLSSTILFLITLFFALWVFDIFVLWIAAYNDSVMFGWQITPILEVPLFLLAIYFTYLVTDKQQKDIPNNIKVILLLVMAVVLILTPTRLNISSYDIVSCEGVLGYLWDAMYTFEFVAIFWILGICIHKFRQLQKGDLFRKQIGFFGAGILSFLVLFVASNIAGEALEFQEISFFGSLGMVIFLGFLTFMMVRFRTFNIRLIGAQALVIGLIAITGSQFFYVKNPVNIVLTVVSFLLLLIFGSILTRSVKREVLQKELIEKQKGELEVAVKGQENLIHIINHQIKGYLAKSRDIFSELLTEPSYGALNKASRPMLDEGFKSLTEGVGFVEGILNSSSASAGTLNYEMKPFDFKATVSQVVENQKSLADQKGLKLSLNIAPGNYDITGDRRQLGEAVRNLIDNSIHYTEKGSVEVALTRPPGKVALTVKDTGIGIAPEDRARLFTPGGRGANAIKVNVSSTGYGLSFVKSVAEAHKGRVGVDSAGPGKGSRFYLELPA